MKTLTIPAGTAIRTTLRGQKDEVRVETTETLSVPVEKVAFSLTQNSQTIILRFPYKGRTATAKFKKVLAATA
jgi:hypothetical protein